MSSTHNFFLIHLIFLNFGMLPEIYNGDQIKYEDIMVKLKYAWGGRSNGRGVKIW